MGCRPRRRGSRPQGLLCRGCGPMLMSAASPAPGHAANIPPGLQPEGLGGGHRSPIPGCKQDSGRGKLSQAALTAMALHSQPHESTGEGSQGSHHELALGVHRAACGHSAARPGLQSELLASFSLSSATTMTTSLSLTSRTSNTTIHQMFDTEPTAWQNYR